MQVSYNWVRKEGSEDIYVISSIQSGSLGFIGLYWQLVVDMEKAVLGLPEIVWGDSIRSFAGPTNELHLFPFSSTPILGFRVNAEDRLEPIVFNEGTAFEERFEGMKVTPGDGLILFGAGTARVPSVSVDMLSTTFDPNSPVEVGDERLNWLLNAVVACLGSPGELRVYDSEGRVTGRVEGTVVEEIPHALHWSSPEATFVMFPEDSHTFEVVGIDNGSYGLDLTSVKDGVVLTFTATDIPTAPGTIHQFSIDWQLLLEGGDGVSIQIDLDGDGVSDTDVNVANQLQGVEIDIKPGSEPNCFNSDGHGVIPVAILSSPEFDATQVDPLTVSLDGQGVRVVGKANTQAHIDDANGDGFDDLMLQIEDVDGSYGQGDGIAILTGKTFDGVSVIGSDSICIVPSEK